VTLLSAHPKGALGMTGSSTNRFHVGGNGTTAFDGTLDDIRVFTNAVDIMTLQGIRNISVNRQTGVGVPPAIQAHPVTQTVNVDQPVSFSVTATGDPEPTYQWRRNGTNIPLVVNSTAMNPSFFIGNAQPAQMGAYDVIVQNQYGMLTSQVANLWVNYPPALLQQPVSHDVYIGMDASLSVQANGYPAPAYRWFRNGNPIPGAIAATYARPSASLADNGTYFVVVSNFMGTVTSSNVYIRVLDPNQLGFDGSDAFRAAPGGGMVLRWATANGRTFDIYWSTNLMAGVEGFVPVATNLPAAPPMNVYTDSVFGVNRRGFYYIESKPIGE